MSHSRRSGDSGSGDLSRYATQIARTAYRFRCLQCAARRNRGGRGVTVLETVIVFAAVWKVRDVDRYADAGPRRLMRLR